MLNICEPLYKHRHPQQVKGDDRLDPKWEMAGDDAGSSASADNAPSVNRRELTDSFGTNVERAEPVSFLARGGGAVRPPFKMRTCDPGGSKRRSVMDRIRSETFSGAKASRSSGSASSREIMITGKRR